MKGKKPSIRTWLLALSASLLLLVAVGQLLFGAFFARNYFLHQKKAEIQDFFSYIRDNYTDSPQSLYNLLREGEDIQNIRVAVFDQSLQILYTSRPMGESYGFEPFLPAPGSVNFSPDPQVTELPAWDGRTEDAHLVLAGSFSYQGQERYVILWVMVESIESSIAAFNQVSLYIVIFVLVLGAAASLLFARRVVRPLRQVQQVSRQVADLDFSARADENAPIRELASLAASVNQMSRRLQDAIGQLRAANEQLQEDVERQRRLEQMQREFVANVSHEMKTPLCLLQMYAENLKYNVAGIDKDYYCDTIIDETERLGGMVSGMLELSAAENGMFTMAMEPLDLGALCRTTLERMAPVLASCQVEAAVDGAFPVRGDAKFLGMAMENFLSNAAGHTPPGGLVQVRLERTDSGIRFTVGNQGPHIPDDQLSRVWDTFYKVDQARTRGGATHAGLGLAIVRNVVARHGGSWSVENTADGVSFSFTIPAQEGL